MNGYPVDLIRVARALAAIVEKINEGGARMEFLQARTGLSAKCIRDHIKFLRYIGAKFEYRAADRAWYAEQKFALWPALQAAAEGDKLFIY